MLSKIDMLYSLALEHAFEIPLDEDFSDLDSLTDPTPNDVRAFCEEIEQIARVPEMSAMKLERRHMQVDMVCKTLNGTAGVEAQAVPAEVTAFVAVVKETHSFVKESRVIESIHEHSKQVAQIGDKIVERLLKDKGDLNGAMAAIDRVEEASVDVLTLLDELDEAGPKAPKTGPGAF